MPAALQLAVMVTVTATAVQEKLIDAPVLNLLTVWETVVRLVSLYTSFRLIVLGIMKGVKMKNPSRGSLFKPLEPLSDLDHMKLLGSQTCSRLLGSIRKVLG